MFWIVIHILVLASLLAVLKKNLLGQVGGMIICCVVVVYGILFDIYVSGAVFFLNPYNNKLYKSFKIQDWILVTLTNLVNLAFFLAVIWLLIRLVRKLSKRAKAMGE